MAFEDRSSRELISDEMRSPEVAELFRGIVAGNFAGQVAIKGAVTDSDTPKREIGIEELTDIVKRKGDPTGLFNETY